MMTSRHKTAIEMAFPTVKTTAYWTRTQRKSIAMEMVSAIIATPRHARLVP